MNRAFELLKSMETIIHSIKGNTEVEYLDSKSLRATFLPDYNELMELEKTLRELSYRNTATHRVEWNILEKIKNRRLHAMGQFNYYLQTIPTNPSSSPKTKLVNPDLCDEMDRKAEENRNEKLKQSPTDLDKDYYVAKKSRRRSGSVERKSPKSKSHSWVPTMTPADTPLTPKHGSTLHNAREYPPSSKDNTVWNDIDALEKEQQRQALEAVRQFEAKEAEKAEKEEKERKWKEQEATKNYAYETIVPGDGLSGNDNGQYLHSDDLVDSDVEVDDDCFDDFDYNPDEPADDDDEGGNDTSATDADDELGADDADGDGVDQTDDIKAKEEDNDVERAGEKGEKELERELREKERERQSAAEEATMKGSVDQEQQNPTTQ